MNKLLLTTLLTVALPIIQSFAQDRTWNGSNGNWGTSTNWNPNSSVFNNTVDLTFQQSGSNLGSNFLGGGARTIRSLTYGSDLTIADVNHALSNQFGGTTARNLIFDSDSGNSFISIASGATSNVNIGAGGGTQGNVILSTNLDITHNGSGVLSITRPMTGTSRTVTISGTGESNFSADNTYTGSTIIDGGTLLITGSTAVGNAITVSAGGTLGGNGTINGTATVNGTLAPGTSPGTLTINNALTLNSTAILAWELNVGDTTIGAGVNDLVTGVSNLTLDGTINFTLLGGPQINTAGTWRLFDYSGTLTNNTLDIGTLNLASGFSASIDTSVANQVNLVVIPEPSTWALLAAGLTVFVVFRRRRLC